MFECVGILFFSIALLLLFFGLYTQISSRPKKIQDVIVNTRDFPIRLIIPKINVDAKVEYTGVTTTGVMEVPETTGSVGWFKLGPQPGERGNAVVAGHFDGKNGEAEVFHNLYKLKMGDKIIVENTKGTMNTFVVREIRMYDPGFAHDVFSASESVHLNLITCDGIWDGDKKSYSKRLVVFADLLLSGGM